MARKRVNTKFLVILSAVLGGGAVLVGGGYYLFKPRDSVERSSQMTEEAFRARDFVSAYFAYSKVAKLTVPPSAEKFVKLGEYARYAAAQNRDLSGMERTAYERALEIDPKYLPAIKKLMEFCWEVARIQPSPDNYQRVRDLAERALTVDPADKRGLEMMPMATVQGWARDIETDPSKLEKDMQTLKEIISKDPGDGESTLVLATAYMKRAKVAASAGRARELEAAINDAGEVFDTALKQSPENLALNFRALGVYAQLRQVDRNNRESREKKYRDTLERARTLTAPDKPFYIEINLAAADDASARAGAAKAAGNPSLSQQYMTTADEIYKQLIGQRPDNQRIRLSYADFLQKTPDTRPKAIELLSKPMDKTGTLDIGSAFGGEIVRQLEAVTKIKLQTYKLDQAQSLGDGPEKSKMLAEISDDLGKLTQEMQDRPEPLVLKGRLEQIQGKHVDAVQTLGRARTLMERRTERSGEYYDLLMKIAESYTQTQQTGPAKDTLKVVIQQVPQYVPARIQLIQLLAREGAGATAIKREYDDAMKSIPKEDVQGLQAMKALETVILKMGGQTGDAMTNLATLPENNKADRLRKAQIAQLMQDFPQAARLFADAYTEDPKDIKVAIQLIQSLVLDGRTDQAKETLKQATEVEPNNPQLQMLQLQLDKATPEEMRKKMEELVNQNPDEFERERQRYELARLNNEVDKARAALKRAAELKPDDRWVLDISFQTAVAEGRLEDAQKLLPKLEAGNYDQAGGALYRFKLQQARGKTQEALATAQQLTRDLPQFAQSWLTLGQAYAAMGDLEQALGGYMQAIQRQANNAEALRGAIDINYRLGRKDDAYRLLKDARARYPQDPGFRDIELNHELVYGQAEAVVKLREDQLAKFLEAAKGKENDPTVKAQLAQAYVEMTSMYTRVATTRQGRGDTAGAKLMWDKATDILLKSVDLPPNDSSSGYLSLVAQLAQAGSRSSNPAKVEEKLRKISDNPNTATQPEPMVILAEFCLNTGKLEESEKAIREAVRRGGTKVGPRRAAAMLLAQMGKVDDAVAMLDGVDNAKSDKVLQRQRAEILLKAGRFDQAEKAVRSMLLDTPDDSDLQNLLTIVLVNGRRYEDAMRQISATLARDSRNLTALYYRAVVQLQSPNGDPRAAVQDLQVVRDNGTLSTEMRMLLVEAYRQVKDNSSVLRELRETLKLDSTNANVRLQLVDALMRQTPPKYDEADKLLDEGLAMPELTGNPNLLLTKARVLLALNNPKAAVAAARLGLNNSNGSAVALQAYLETLLAAKESKQLVLETDAFVQGPGEKPFWLYVMRGAARRQLDDREGAVNEFASALQAANDDDSTIRSVSAMADFIGADEAIKAISGRYDQAIRWRLMGALLHQTKGRGKEAVEVLEPALANVDKLVKDEQIRVLRTAGMLLVTPGPQLDYDRAVDIYRKLLKLTPDDLATLNNLAFILSDKVRVPNPAQALEYSTRAVDLIRRAGGIDPLVFDTHGWILVLNGRVSEGINILSEAINKRSFLEGHYHLGAAYLKAGLLREGVDQLKRAETLSKNPGVDPSYVDKIADAMKQADALNKEQQKNR